MLMGEYYIAHSAKGKVWSKHKYIYKKLGKTGKYIYVYAKDKASDIGDTVKDLSGYSTKQEMKKRKREYELAKQQKENAEMQANYYGNWHKNPKTGRLERKPAAASYMRQVSKRDYDNAKDMYEYEKEKYDRTPLGRAEKAKNAVSKSLSRIGKKKTKRKKKKTGVIKDRAIKENTIKDRATKENTLKENVLKENVLKENVLKENVIR